MTDQNTITEESPRMKTVNEVQDELISHLASLVPYWIETTLDRTTKDTITYRLSGMMHSLWATFAGSAGGFSASVDMYPFSTEAEVTARIAEGMNYFAPSAEVSSDINDGGLQYHSAENYVTAPESAVPPREWNQDEARALLFNKVADLLHEAVDRDDLSDLEKGNLFLRSIIDTFENGAEDFPKVMLLVVSQDEDKEFFIENGEDYYDDNGTQMTGQERSLLEVWDFYWDRIVRRNAGLHVESLFKG